MPLYEFDRVQPQLPAAGRYWIAPSAELIGSVTLDEDVSVWFGAVLRGDNDKITIGGRTNVQDGCIFHTDPGFPLTVGANCTIGHRAVLHGCTVGEGSLIGMGAIVLNGAKIGAHSIVGAGAVVTEGKEYPPRSLIVGTPGRAIRTLDDEAVAMAAAGAQSYYERWQRFAKSMKPVV